MKYIYRIIFMPGVLLAMILVLITVFVTILLHGNADKTKFEFWIGKAVMPLIRLME